SAAIDSLDRCMACLPFQDIEPYGTVLGAPPAHSMPNGFLGIFRHKRLEFGLGSFMIEKSSPGIAKKCCQFCPRVGRAHVDDTQHLDARARRFGIHEVRWFTG